MRVELFESLGIIANQLAQEEDCCVRGDQFIHGDQHVCGVVRRVQDELRTVINGGRLDRMRQSLPKDFE